MGDVAHATNVPEYCFVIGEILIAVFVFAAIIGNVGNIITSMNAERDMFQGKMDGVKRYMVLRNVNKDLEHRVIRSVLWLPNSLSSGLQYQTKHYNTFFIVYLFMFCAVYWA